MKIANITPIPYLDRVIDDDETCHMVMTDLVLDNEAYRDFYRARSDRGDYVILNPSVYETGIPTSPTTLFDAARMINPSAIVLSDDPGNPDISHMTSELVTLHWHELEYPMRSMADVIAVPHGKSLSMFMNKALYLARLPRVSGIGVTEPWISAEIVKNLHRGTRKHIYLLGATDGLEELTDPYVRQHVPICATSKLVAYGLAGRRITPGKPPAADYPGRTAYGGRTGYFHHDQEGKVSPAVAQNIKSWRMYDQARADSE